MATVESAIVYIGALIISLRPAINYFTQITRRRIAISYVVLLIFLVFCFGGTRV
jgi:FtsH-binding integral membrane protein